MGRGGLLIIQKASWAMSGSVRQTVAERGLPDEELSWAMNWGCTGRTGFPGTASAANPASESPR